jgi:hypothetical protein
MYSDFAFSSTAFLLWRFLECELLGATKPKPLQELRLMCRLSDKVAPSHHRSALHKYIHSEYILKHMSLLSALIAAASQAGTPGAILDTIAKWPNTSFAMACIKSYHKLQLIISFRLGSDLLPASANAPPCYFTMAQFQTLIQCFQWLKLQTAKQSRNCNSYGLNCSWWHASAKVEPFNHVEGMLMERFVVNFRLKRLLPALALAVCGNFLFSFIFSYVIFLWKADLLCWQQYGACNAYSMSLVCFWKHAAHRF